MDGDDVAILNALYAAAGEPADWPDTITVLADHLGAMGGILVRNAVDPEHSSCVTGRMDPETTELYLREYTDNPWTTAASSVPIGRAGVISRLCDSREGRHLAWYSDIIVPTRTCDMVFLNLPGFTSAYSVGGLAFCFSDLGSRRVDDAARRLDEWATHIARAVWLSQQVHRSRVMDRQLDDMLRSSPQPVLLLSAAGRVVGVNPAAERFLRDSADFTVDATGVFRAVSPVDDAALHAAILCARTPSGASAAPAVAYADRSRLKPLRLLITPMPSDHALPAPEPEHQPVMRITVVDVVNSHDDTIGALSAVYRLTPREARVATLLATGIGREEVAYRLHVSVETVKKHTAACFRKVGVHSQAGLAHIVSSLPCGASVMFDR